MIYLQLFWEFFKTGLFAVGGGLATLPFLRDISLKYPWFTPNDLLDMIAVSESTPGPLGVNASTYAGFHAAGIPGALAATFSLVLPSVIVIILVYRALDRFRDSSLVKDGFYGLRPASAGLIFGAILEVFAASLFHTELWSGLRSLPAVLNLPAIGLFFALSLAIWKLPKIHPIFLLPSARPAAFCSDFKKSAAGAESPAALFIFICLSLPRQVILHNIAEMLCRNPVFAQQSRQPCGFFKSWRNIVNAVKPCLSTNSRDTKLRSSSRLAFCNNVVNHLLYTPLSSLGASHRFFRPRRFPFTPSIHTSPAFLPLRGRACEIHFTRSGGCVMSKIAEQKLKKFPQMG